MIMVHDFDDPQQLTYFFSGEDAGVDDNAKAHQSIFRQTVKSFEHSDSDESESVEELMAGLAELTNGFNQIMDE
jgi:hypothetical protein